MQCGIIWKNNTEAKVNFKIEFFIYYNSYCNMEKIYIDIDNNTPGAIVNQIVAFISPKCILHGADEIIAFSLTNKYCNACNKVIESPVCNIHKFCNKMVCLKHSKDYHLLENIHNTVTVALRNGDSFVHFKTKDIADKAAVLLGKTQRCCLGKGFRL